MHPNDRTVSIEKIAKNVTQIRSTPESDKINPMTFSDIVQSNPEPLENILSPWLPKKGSALIYAAAGVGKTFFALNIAYAIASGNNFLKFTVPKPKRVLYIDGEMSYPELYSRLISIIKQQGDLDATTENNFFLLTPDKVYPSRLPKIDTPEGQLFYNRIIDENEIEVIVFDNYATLSLFDENIAEEWNFLQDWFIELRARGKSIIGVHHAGKDKKGFRGTSRLLDCVDTAISLQEIIDYTSESDSILSKKFKIEYQKSRTFGGKESLPFEVILKMSGWDFESVEANNIQRILEMHTKLEMKNVNIAKELGLSESYVSRIIRKNIIRRERYE